MISKRCSRRPPTFSARIRTASSTRDAAPSLTALGEENADENRGTAHQEMAVKRLA